MVKVEITGYDESNDSFSVDVRQQMKHMGKVVNESNFPSSIPAWLLPYVAPDETAMTDDLPFGLVGQTITLTNPYF